MYIVAVLLPKEKEQAGYTIYEVLPKPKTLNPTKRASRLHHLRSSRCYGYMSPWAGSCGRGLK